MLKAFLLALSTLTILPIPYSSYEGADGKKAAYYFPIVGLIIGTGMGAGLILDGKLSSGNSCGAGEFGKIPYKMGTLESYCSEIFFDSNYGQSFEEVLHHAQSGDQEAIDIFKEFGVQIGDLEEGEGTTVREVARTMRVILRNAYVPKGNSDQLRENVAHELRTKMEEIRRRCDETNGGSYQNVMGTDNYNELEVEFEDGEDGAKVATCELEFDIIYSVNNK